MISMLEQLVLIMLLLSSFLYFLSTAADYQGEGKKVWESETVHDYLGTENMTHDRIRVKEKVSVSGTYMRGKS